MSKKDKRRAIYLATYFPVSGEPDDVIMELTENDTLEYEGHEWALSPNSVWIDKKNKRRRVICMAGVPETLSSSFAAGKSYMTARIFFLFMKMRLLEEWFKLQNMKKWYKNPGTWVVTGALFLVALVLVWGVIAVDGGLQSLAEIMRGIEIGGGGTSGAGGHEQIGDAGNRS